jgi:hypothetical protein
MLRVASKVTSVVAVIVLVAAAVFVAPSLRGAHFEIVNESSEVATVIASWADQEMEIGAIRPGSSRRFNLHGEAAMRFSARFPGGRDVESREIYFTDGVTVVAIISAAGVEVRYHFET